MQYTFGIGIYPVKSGALMYLGSKKIMNSEKGGRLLYGEDSRFSKVRKNNK